MERILITGSNRGIGLALVAAYQARTDVEIFATCRTPAQADDLKRLAAESSSQVHVVPLDVSDEESVVRAVAHVQSITDTLDILINNAGINPNEPNVRNLGEFELDAITHVVGTNASTPIVVTQAFLPLLRQAQNPRVLFVSSTAGSIEREASGTMLAYRMSKAAMNMGARVLANALRPEGIIVIPAHPGWVQTDMGGANAAITPRESAEGLIEILDHANMQQSGEFVNYDGTPMPW